MKVVGGEFELSLGQVGKAGVGGQQSVLSVT